MKTAIQELIEFINTSHPPQEENRPEQLMEFYLTLQVVKTKAKELLSKEKNQICLAWEDGYYSNAENLQNENERYYNDTYEAKYIKPTHMRISSSSEGGDHDLI